MTDIRSDNGPTTTPPPSTDDIRRAGMAAAWVALAEHWQRRELREVLGMIGVIESDPAPRRSRRRPTGRLG